MASRQTGLGRLASLHLIACGRIWFADFFGNGICSQVIRLNHQCRASVFYRMLFNLPQADCYGGPAISGKNETGRVSPACFIYRSESRTIGNLVLQDAGQFFRLIDPLCHLGF